MDCPRSYTVARKRYSGARVIRIIASTYGTVPVFLLSSLSHLNVTLPSPIMQHTPTLVFILSFASSAFASQNPFPFSPGFDIEAVAAIAKALPSHSWEFGTAAEALLELYNPEISVFGNSTFPVPTLDVSNVQSLTYAKSKISFGWGANSLVNGDGAVGDPASLGVSAVLLGQSNSSYTWDAQQRVDYIMNSAPRFWNGAISQREDIAELW
jgi:hypothetical protein